MGESGKSLACCVIMLQRVAKGIKATVWLLFEGLGGEENFV